MVKLAVGMFEVELRPQAEPDSAAGTTLGRMSIDKQFHGDLEGSSKGQMLTAMTNVDGSAGYVAIERFTGTLHGRQGSFVLQHAGIMSRGEQRLTITVVPDSASDELAGLMGVFQPNMVDGQHLYTFEYTLPES